MKLVRLPAVYLDLCALQRPYDDQRAYRIKREAAAVESIIAQAKTGSYVLYYSPVHEDEIRRNTNEVRRTDLELLLHSTGKYAKPLVKDADALEARGWELASAGLGIADALHIAYAEALDADFVTCDDELLSRGRRCKIKVWVGLPDDYCRKENLP